MNAEYGMCTVKCQWETSALVVVFPLEHKGRTVGFTSKS